MRVLKVLRARPDLFFRLSGISQKDFEALVVTLHPIWLESERQRLSRKGRQRAIGGGMNYRLEFAEQLLLCLMYYRTYTSQVFMGLVFNVSSPTVSRRVNAMTKLMAGHFRMPERRVKLSEAEKAGHRVPDIGKCHHVSCIQNDTIRSRLESFVRRGTLDCIRSVSRRGFLRSLRL